MTQSLEDEFNLPRLADILKANELESAKRAADETLSETIDTSEVDEVGKALMNVDPSRFIVQDPTGVETHEQEADKIVIQAMQAYRDLLDLGFNIESKHAGANAFSPAAKMLEIALKASQSKTTKKLERLKLAMEKELHDREMQNDQEEGIVQGEQSFMASRKDLIEKIRKGEI